MKRHRKSRSSEDSVADMAAMETKVISERVRMMNELLQSQALAMIAIEETQRKFRTAVLLKLSTIEATVVRIHGAQIAEAHLRDARGEQKLKESIEAAESFISKTSNEIGLAMVNYIYGATETPSASRKAGRPRQRKRDDVRAGKSD